VDDGSVDVLTGGARSDYFRFESSNGVDNFEFIRPDFLTGVDRQP
jgi:hypothetical protein